MGVGLHVEARRIVTLGADGIAFGAYFQRMRVVAIAAGYAFGVHATLQERAIFVHLILNLTVGMIESRV
jgi:hypothetical protein